MDSEQWEREATVQNDYLRTQLAALRKGGRKRWRQFRLLEMVCGKCGDTVLEVMNLDPYRVVCFWDSSVRLGENPAPDAPVQAWIERAENTPLLIRRGQERFFPIPQPWTPSAHELVMTACRCRGWTLTAESVADTLTAEIRKVVRHPE